MHGIRHRPAQGPGADGRGTLGPGRTGGGDVARTPPRERTLESTPGRESQPMLWTGVCLIPPSRSGRPRGVSRQTGAIIAAVNTFASTIKNIETAYRQLVEMDRPFRVDTHPSPVRAKLAAVYLLHGVGRPLYVGRTRDLRRRLSDHLSSLVSKATLAVRMARITAGKGTTYKSNRSAKYLHDNDPTFQAEFSKARACISAMQVRYVCESNDVRQALLEIYAAVQSDTLLREGADAGRLGGYNSFKTS